MFVGVYIRGRCVASSADLHVCNGTGIFWIIYELEIDLVQLESLHPSKWVSIKERPLAETFGQI